VTRFRGMISTQPGSTPLASFKILSLEEAESHGSYCSGNDIGRIHLLQFDALRLYFNWSHEGLTEAITCLSADERMLFYTAIPLKWWWESVILTWKHLPFRLYRVRALIALTLL